MKLVIQIPCLNEADTLPDVVNHLPRQLPGISSIEYLVIDDGSTDGTAEIAPAHGVHRVVRHKRRRGLAAAFSTGLRESVRMQADIIVNTDGDHQYPGIYIASLVAPIVSGEADLVVGDRCPADDLRNPLFKRVLYRFGRFFVSRLAGMELPDPVSGFRAYSREAAIQTHIVTGFSYTIESLLQAARRGMAIKFVPIQTNRARRPSRLFKNIPQFLLRSGVTLVRVFFMCHPLQVFVAVSGVLSIIGFIPIVRFLFLFAAGDGQGHIQSLILGAAVLLIAGMLLLAGLVADLISQHRQLTEEVLECLRTWPGTSAPPLIQPPKRDGN